MNRCKLLVFYLPQFHRVKENDLWWGKGFTEWTAVKEAKPLFEGHKQPHVPYKKRYYNLLDKETMCWQAQLMKEYGIDGACFYHYYFKDGRRLLEKPAENLLKWKDISMPFCFSWANEPWVRSWSNIRGNVWSDVRDKNLNDSIIDNGILMEQNYGEIDDWKEHFKYLLPFFRDDRYLKKDGKPVFIFYKPQAIGCLREMVICWRELANAEGLPGIYLMGTGGAEVDSCLDEIYIHEPQETFKNFMSLYKDEKNIARYLNYDEVWQHLLCRQLPKSPVSLGAFIDYDDSPRRGRNSTVIYGKTPKKFCQYLSELIVKAVINKSSFIFLNAWNEWGEGMYLEPDEESGMNYLNAIKESRSRVEQINDKIKTKYILDMKYNESKAMKTEISLLRKQIERYGSFWHLLHGLLLARERNISFGGWLLERGYKKVAIYGLGMVGHHLAALLNDTGLSPAFALDESGNLLSRSFPVLSLNDTPLEVDLIIVTVTYDFTRIKKNIAEVYSCHIISLKELLDDLVLLG